MDLDDEKYKFPPRKHLRPGFPVPAFLKSGVTDTQVRSFADAAAVYINKALGESLF